VRDDVGQQRHRDDRVAPHRVAQRQHRDDPMLAVGQDRIVGQDVRARGEVLAVA